MRALFQEICRILCRIGSKSQLVSGYLERSLETSSVVTHQVKDEKLGGVNGGGK